MFFFTFLSNKYMLFLFSVPSDTDFDFEISVPKPPSFGSSTKVSQNLDY